MFFISLFFNYLIIQYFVHNINGFYVPGVAPQDFNDNDPVEVKVRKI